MKTKKKLHIVLLTFSLIIIALFLLILIIPSNNEAPDTDTAQPQSSSDDNTATIVVIVVLALFIFSFTYAIATLVIFISKKCKKTAIRQVQPCSDAVNDVVKLPSPEASYLSAPTQSVSPFGEAILSKLREMSNVEPLLGVSIDKMFSVHQIATTMLQRTLKIGYSQADHIIQQMEELGMISPFMGSSPRTIYLSEDIWATIRNQFFAILNEKNNEKGQEPLPEKVNNDVNEQEPSPVKLTGLIQDAMQEEDEWFRQQLGMTPVEYVLYRVDRMSGIEFENWCQRLLVINNFSKATTTKASNDQGVDILAEKDGIKYAFQCKCYSSDLGNKPVQEVNVGKAIYGCHVGVVITNRHFTAGAKEAAAATGILLWDREHLSEMITQALSNSDYRTLILKAF